MKKRKKRNRYRISDELWEKIEPLIPKHTNTHRFGGGSPRVPDRKAHFAKAFSFRQAPDDTHPFAVSSQYQGP